VAIKGGEVLRTPGLSFPNGYHIKLIKKNDERIIVSEMCIELKCLW